MPGARLTDSQRDRIHLEEQYRAEIRTSLAEKGKRNWLGRFLNSQFGLWLLSAIFLSGFGSLYACEKEKWDTQRALSKEVREQVRVRDEAVRKLDLEIAFRLSNLLAYLDGKYLQQTGAEKSARAEKITPARLTFMIQVPPSGSVQYGYPTLSLYAENRDTTIIGLLAQLSVLERERGHDTADIDRVIARLSAIPALFERKRLADPTENARAVASALQEEVVLDRWRRNAFSFMDCNVREPFC